MGYYNHSLQNKVQWFMASPLSNLVNNLAEGINKIKCKDFNCFLECKSVKDNPIKYNLYQAI